MKRFTVQNPWDEIRQYQRRVIIITVLMILLVGALIVRLVYLQISQHHYYLTLSRQNLLSVSPIDPSRGLIYDRHGILLAGNIPVFSLEVIPDKIKNLKQTLRNLSKIIHLSDSDLQAFHKQLSQHRQFNSVPLKIKLSEKEMAVFALNQYQFPGFFIQAHMVRYYPFGPLMEPVLGYVGRINAEEFAKVDLANYSASNYIGKTGIEKYDETLLHGITGIQQIETSAEGNVIRSQQDRPAVAGQNIYLTIDSKLQAAAREALQDQAGAVVMIDPRNGDVLAFVSQPAFDPNQFVTGISNAAYQILQNNPERPLFNRVLQGEFPPGSTIKLFYALGGLGTGIISTESSFFCPGYFKLPNSTHIYHDWARKFGHGEVDVKRAIIESCDVFFFHLAEKTGIERMGNMLKKFGFGSPTGIDTSVERPGLVPSPEWKKHVHHQPWFPGDTVVMGIGQGYLLVTPIQLATAVMRLVNHGHGYQPHLLLKTESPSGKIAPEAPQKSPLVNIPEEDWDLVLQAMRGVVEDPHGTGYHAGHTAKYTFGGKSGTAQVFGLKGNQTDKANKLPQKLRDHSWFIAFAPADHPTVVLTLFIEHGGEGHATYLARKILDSYFEINPLRAPTRDSANDNHEPF
jgi:penicillin-binding protein 2